jgi:hypothetical protein
MLCNNLTVLIIFRGKEKGTKKLFPSPRKHVYIQKRAKNLFNFQNEVLWRIVLEYYDKGEFPTAKKVTLALGEK